MLRYEKWATETLLASCRDLAPAQLEARMPGVSGSVAELLTHVVGGQQAFLARTGGQQADEGLTRESAWPGVDVLLALSAAACDGLLAVAGGLDEERDVDLPFMGKVFRFPASFFLAHAVEHGAEHRTEIKVALGQMGIETPDLDGWAFAAAQGYGREVQDSSSESR
jgi:uncharacterized damage-inducible protein DinB